MPQPFQCPKTETHDYRKSIPAPLRPLMGRGREWKVSLGTKPQAEAHPLFTAKSARCEAAIKLARASLNGESKLQPSDGPKLADRWVAAELTARERNSDRIRQFLAHSKS